MTNRLLGLHAYRSESTKSKYERIASHVLHHDTNLTLKTTHIEESQSLHHLGKSIVEIVSSAYHMDSSNNNIPSPQDGGGGLTYNTNNGLYNTRERCIRNIHTFSFNSYIFIHMHTHSYRFIHTHTYSYIYSYIFIYIHTYSYIFIHVHTYSYIHIRIHTYSYIFIQC